MQPVASAEKPVNVSSKAVATNDEDRASSVATTPSPHSGRNLSLPEPRSVGLTSQGVPDKIKRVEYAVRGPILLRANELARDLSNQPFDKVIPCHIGNPMALGMKPLTYIRETVALVACPNLLELDGNILNQCFAADNIARAKRYLQFMKNVGAYTESLGAAGVRGEIANFLERRDGLRPDIDTIMVTNGASEAINTLLACLVGGGRDGILTPIPQYPLYSASITKLGGHVLGYELDEENNWGLDMGTIERAFDRALKDGINVKAIVVICPGNPAPCFLTREQVVSILKFAMEKEILVIADEVYQDNCYVPEKPFVPFRKVLLEEGLKTQLASLHSSSKGVYGECGFRGGFCQLENIPADGRAIVLKMRSVELCSNTMGQVVIACVTNPPLPGDPSYETYRTERELVFNELKEKAMLAAEFFNSLPQTSCQPILGAMYAFPRIDFSPLAIAEASKRDQSVEMMYCLELLEKTGFVTSNGDGFGQRAGTHHIRFAILPSIKMLRSGLENYRRFHVDFMNRYKA